MTTNKETKVKKKKKKGKKEKKENQPLPHHLLTRFENKKKISPVCPETPFWMYPTTGCCCCWGAHLKHLFVPKLQKESGYLWMSVSLGRSILFFFFFFFVRKKKFCFGVGLDDVIHTIHQKILFKHPQTETLKTYLPNFGRKQKEGNLN